MSQHGAEHRTRLGALGDYYWSSARRAIRVIHGVPADWPAPVRFVVQTLVAIIAIALVPVAWIFKTVLLVLKIIGGTPSQGGSPSGPPKFPTGNG